MTAAACHLARKPYRPAGRRTAPGHHALFQLHRNHTENHMQEPPPGSIHLLPSTAPLPDRSKGTPSSRHMAASATSSLFIVLRDWAAIEQPLCMRAEQCAHPRPGRRLPCLPQRRRSRPQPAAALGRRRQTRPQAPPGCLAAPQRRPPLRSSASPRPDQLRRVPCFGRSHQRRSGPAPPGRSRRLTPPPGCLPLCLPALARPARPIQCRPRGSDRPQHLPAFSL